jgi:hypothetical protein
LDSFRQANQTSDNFDDLLDDDEIERQGKCSNDWAIAMTNLIE